MLTTEDNLRKLTIAEEFSYPRCIHCTVLSLSMLRMVSMVSMLSFVFSVIHIGIIILKSK